MSGTRSLKARRGGLEGADPLPEEAARSSMKHGQRKRDWDRSLSRSIDRRICGFQVMKSETGGHSRTHM